MKKLLLTIATMALGMNVPVANAAPVNAAGVILNTGINKLLPSDALFETVVINTGDELKGFGRMSTGTGILNICAGCELTYVFDSFILSNINMHGTFLDPLTLNLADLTFTGGSIKFFIDYNADWSNAAPLRSQAADGSLWLELAGHTDLHLGQMGTLFSDNVKFFGTGADEGNGGVALFDVVGGLAMTYLDTNGKADNLGGFADLLFTSSFGPSADVFGFPISGTANLRGNVVPEPTTLGLLGLGLMGIGFTARRRRKS